MNEVNQPREAQASEFDDELSDETLDRPAALFCGGPCASEYSRHGLAEGEDSMSDAARPRFQREFAAARNRAKPVASDAAA